MNDSKDYGPSARGVRTEGADVPVTGAHRQGSIRARIVALVDHIPATADEIAEAIEHPADIVRPMLDAMRRAGTIEVVGRVPPPPGRGGRWQNVWGATACGPDPSKCGAPERAEPEAAGLPNPKPEGGES